MCGSVTPDEDLCGQDIVQSQPTVLRKILNITSDTCVCTSGVDHACSGWSAHLCVCMRAWLCVGGRVLFLRV